MMSVSTKTAPGVVVREPTPDSVLLHILEQNNFAVIGKLPDLSEIPPRITRRMCLHSWGLCSLPTCLVKSEEITRTPGTIEKIKEFLDDGDDRLDLPRSPQILIRTAMPGKLVLWNNPMLIIDRDTDKCKIFRNGRDPEEIDLIEWLKENPDLLLMVHSDNTEFQKKECVHARCEIDLRDAMIVTHSVNERYEVEPRIAIEEIENVKMNIRAARGTAHARGLDRDTPGVNVVTAEKDKMRFVISESLGNGVSDRTLPSEFIDSDDFNSALSTLIFLGYYKFVIETRKYPNGRVQVMEIDEYEMLGKNGILPFEEERLNHFFDK